VGAINHQFAYKQETTYGTAVVVDTFLEFTSETLRRRQNIGGSDGIRPSTRLGRGSTRRITRNWAEGTVNFEVATEKFGRLFKVGLGAVSTAQPEETNSPTVYLHTFTPGTLTGKSLTLQKGVEANDGTVFAFTYPGSKISGFGFSQDPDGVLQMATDFLARQEVSSTALATANYSAPDVFHYAQGTVLIDDVTNSNVISFSSVRYQNNFPIDRLFKLGNAGLMAEPLNRPRDTLGGTLRIEFEDRDDFYEAFAADTSVEIRLDFEGDAIDDTYNNLLKLTIADARFTGETPQIPNTDVIVVDVPFTAWDPASGDAFTIEYQNTESTYGA
jgi:hypothetical protein